MPHFKPPYPKPNKSKLSLVKRFAGGFNSWIHVLFEKSYKMKLGHVKLPKTDLFMPCEPSLVKKVMKTEYKDYPKHKLLGKMLKPLLGESIFTTNGKEWERQRKMMNPAFAHTHLKTVFPLMSDAVNDMVNRFNRYKADELIHIDVEMTHITADVIFRTILSHPLKGEEAEELFLAFNNFQELSQKIMTLKVYGIPTFFIRKKSEAEAAKIRNILASVIKERYDSYHNGEPQKHDDILFTMLKAEDERTGENFKYEELVDHILMLFLAGHETSASALTWSLYLIAACPHTQQKLKQEIEQVAGGESIEYEHVKQLKFTHDVFREALRLYPPVGFFLREAAKEKEMRKKKIKKGDMVIVSPWLIHRHRDQWEDPDSFCPARFSDDSEKSKKSIKESYLPFGDGPRICIGAGFATQEAIIILANLVQNFEFKTSKDHTPEPVGRVTIRPKNGVWLFASKR